MLGDDAVKEEFEQFNDVNPDLWIGPELYIYDDVLDSSTLIDDRTGWVVEGVSFSSVSGALTIRDANHTNVLSAIGTRPRSLIIDFWEPVSAFGFDFYTSYLGGVDVTITIFAEDDTTILGTETVRTFFALKFIGAEDFAGIGSVKVSSIEVDESSDYDVRVDNVTFGVAPPLNCYQNDLKGTWMAYGVTGDTNNKTMPETVRCKIKVNSYGTIAGGTSYCRTRSRSGVNKLVSLGGLVDVTKNCVITGIVLFSNKDGETRLTIEHGTLSKGKDILSIQGYMKHDPDLVITLTGMKR